MTKKRPNVPMTNSPLQAAYRSSIRWSLAGAVGTAFFQLCQMVVFTRIAGPTAAGDYALAATFMAFLHPLTEAGISQAVVQPQQARPAQLATLAWVNFALGALIFSGLWLWGGAAIGDWYGRAEFRSLLLWMAASLFFTPFGTQHAGILMREMRFEASAKIEIFAWACSLLATATLAWQGWGAHAMAMSFLLRNGLNTLGCLWAGNAIFPINWLKVSHLREVRPFFRFSFYDLSAAWAEFFSNYLDKLIVGKWLGVTALGYYNLAFTFLMLPTARLGYIVTRVSFPVYARLRDDRAALDAFFRQSAREVTLTLYPLYASMVVFSSEIVLIFFGEKWLPTAPLFVAFGLAGLVRTLAAPFPHLTRGIGRPQRWLGWLLVFTLAVNAALVALLSLHPAVESAAWARTATKFLVEIGMLTWLARRCGVQFWPVLRFAGRVAACLAPAVLLTWAVGCVSRDFYVATALKSMAFAIGLVWFALRSPLHREVKSLARLFFSKEKTG
jgi:O-antigen/teichoic acid export membrane protein